MTTPWTEPVLRAAAHLAAAGDGRTALSLIGQLEADGPSAAVLLLKAKVLAQSGQYDQAIEAWKAVLEGDADNAEAKAGIDRAEKAKEGLGRVFYRYSLAFQVLLAAVGMVAAVGLWAVPGLLHGKEARTAQGSLDRINQRLDRLESAMVPSTSDPSGKSAPSSAANAEFERLRTRLTGLEKLLQTRTTDTEREFAALRAQIAKGRAPEAAQLAPSRAELDQLAARVTAIESQAEGQRAEVSQALSEFQGRLDRVRCEQLIWQAIEISQRRDVTSGDLDHLARIAKDIPELSQDEQAREYALRLTNWVRKRREP